MKKSKKDWKVYAGHIVDMIDRMQQLVKRGDLYKDQDLYDSALRKLQALSEATQHLPDDLKKKHAEINWRSIIGFRNILVHDYLSDHIDIQTIIDVIENDLPQLHKAVKDMLAHATKKKSKK